MSKISNAYTAVSQESFVQDLLAHRVEVQCADEVAVFPCFRPMGKGFDVTKAGYVRTNYLGKKVMVHQLVLEVKKERPSESHEVSHLCGNEWCCNPDHLAWEQRADNISRRNCKAFVYVEAAKQWIALCTHNPPCKTTAFGTVVEDDAVLKQSCH